jgi:hypothetical protein
MSSVKVYVADRDPYLTISTDLGATWLDPYIDLSSQMGVLGGLVVKSADNNFLLVYGDYTVATPAMSGIIYSTDGGTTFTQATGTWLSGATSNEFRSTTTCSTGEIIIASQVDDVVISTDGGLTFSVLTTVPNILGGPVPPATYCNAISSYDATDIIASINDFVYSSTDAGITWISIGQPDAGFDVKKVFIKDLIVLASTENGVFSYSSGVWSQVITFANPGGFSGSVLETLDGISVITSDLSDVYNTIDGFVTVNTGASLSTSFWSGSIYNSNSGFFIKNGAVWTTYFTTDYGVNLTQGADILTQLGMLPFYVASVNISGCGCQPGFTYDPVSGNCISQTGLCQNGGIYNPTTGLCESAAVVPCDLDLVLSVDASSSITAEQMSETKQFLRNLVDALELGYDTNGVLNTPANSAERITNGEIKVGIVVWNDADYMINQVGVPVQILDLTGGPTAWLSTNATGSGTIKDYINDIRMTFGLPEEVNGSYYDPYNVLYLSSGGNADPSLGLAAAYSAALGPGSRPAANKRILFITNNYPTDYNTGTIYNTSSTVPYGYAGVDWNPVVGDWSTYCGVNGQVDLSSPSYIGYQDYNQALYNMIMDLAQEIKAGTATPLVGAPTAVDITLAVLGDAAQTANALAAYVGLDPTSTADPCLWATTGVTPPLCPDIYAEYTGLGSAPYPKFPSNNISTLPDYHTAEFTNAALAALVNPMVNSLVCTIATAPYINCQYPCVTVQLPTGEWICECTSPSAYVSCCYDLINCADGSVFATVNTSSSDDDFMAQYIDQYIYVEGFDVCLYVQVTNACTNSTTISDLANITSYTSCQECNEDQEVIPCYSLSRCDDPTVTISTNSDLSMYQPGQILTFQEYPNVCWSFTIDYSCSGVLQSLTPTVSYNDCPTCISYNC